MGLEMYLPPRGSYISFALTVNLFIYLFQLCILIRVSSLILLGSDGTDFATEKDGRGNETGIQTRFKPNVYAHLIFRISAQSHNTLVLEWN
jgi:hypothetical protein